MEVYHNLSPDNWGKLEFAKLRAFRTFLPYVPSRLTCLDLYTPWLRALRALFAHLTHAPLNVTKSLTKNSSRMF